MLPSFAYFHGGPGFNSYAEEELLGPGFRELGRAHFWNEPSRFRLEAPLFRSERAFENLAESARTFLRDIVRREGPAHVIGHSFASATLGRIVCEEPELFRSLTLSAPVIDFGEVWARIIRIAIEDFRQTDSLRRRMLEEAFGKMGKSFDSSMQEAFRLVGEDSLLLTHYFKQPGAMASYLGVWGRKGLSLDMDSFFAVMRDFVGRPNLVELGKKSDVPVSLVFGKHDRLISSELETALANQVFTRSVVHVFENSAHYPMLEETELFFTLLRRLQ